MAKVKLFLTWSGERSRRVAETLRSWLPSVIQNLDPWMSESDIDKGTRWASEISQQLQQSKIGIICLTAENLTAPWINFEAGALSKLDGSYVCTFLFDVAPAQVEFPLAQFQATKLEKEDIKKLLHTLNQRQSEAALTPEQVDKGFEKWWPDLQSSLSSIPKAPSTTKPPQRSAEEMLEEVLATVREHTQAQTTFAEQLRMLSGLTKTGSSPNYRSLWEIGVPLANMSESERRFILGFPSKSTEDAPSIVPHELPPATPRPKKEPEGTNSPDKEKKGILPKGKQTTTFRPL